MKIGWVFSKKYITLYSMASIADFLLGLIGLSQGVAMRNEVALADVHKQSDLLKRHLEILNNDNDPLWVRPEGEKLKERLGRLRKQFVYLNGAMAHDAGWLFQLKELAKTIKISDPDCAEAADTFEQMLQDSRKLKQESARQEEALYRELMARDAQTRQMAANQSDQSGDHSGTATGDGGTDTEMDDGEEQPGQPRQGEPRIKKKKDKEVRSWHVRMILRRLMSERPDVLTLSDSDLTTEVNKLLPKYGCKQGKGLTVQGFVQLQKLYIRLHDLLKLSGYPPAEALTMPLQKVPPDVMSFTLSSARAMKKHTATREEDVVRAANVRQIEEKIRKLSKVEIPLEPLDRAGAAEWQKIIIYLLSQLGVTGKNDEIFDAVAEIHWELQPPSVQQRGGGRHWHQAPSQAYPARTSVRKEGKSRRRTKNNTQARKTPACTAASARKAKSRRRTRAKQGTTRYRTNTRRGSTKTNTRRGSTKRKRTQQRR
jgi:hypothetical protein